MKNKLYLSCLLFSLIATKILAQDPCYSQYWVDKMYLNPALCGSDKGLRVSTIFRDQWPGIISKFITYGVGVELNEPNLSGALGFHAMQNIEGEGIQKQSEYTVNYTWRAPLIRKQSDFSLSIASGIVTRSINYSGLIFSDQLDPVNGLNGNPTGAPLSSIQSALGTIFHCGLSFRSFIKKSDSYVELGLSGSNLNTPNLSLYGGEDARLPFKYSVHIDVSIPSNPTGGAMHIQPGIKYSHQKDFNTTSLGILLKSNHLITGIYYRYEKWVSFIRNDAVTTIVGVKISGVNVDYLFTYSYDITVSKLAVNTGGSHEIGLVMNFYTATLFGNLTSLGRRRSNSCPDFNNKSF